MRGPQVVLASLASAILLLHVSASAAGADAGAPAGRRAAGVPDGLGVVTELTNETFHAFVDAHETVVVNFYAPWCGVCRKLEPEYEDAAALATEYPLLANVRFARVDAVKFREFADDEGVTSYPTIFVRRAGFADRFPLRHSSPSIVSTLHTHLGYEATPCVKNLKQSAEEISTWLFWRGTDLGRMDSTAVLFIPTALRDAPRTQAVDAAFTAASSLVVDDVRFARVADNDAVLTAFKLPLDQLTLVLYKDFDEGRTALDIPALFEGEPDAAATAERLANWVRRWNVPLVAQGTHLTLQNLRRYNQTLVHYFIQEQALNEPRVLARIQKKLTAIGLEFEARGLTKRGDLTFLVTNGHQYHGWMSHFQLADNQFPALGIDDQVRHRVFARSFPTTREIDILEEMKDQEYFKRMEKKWADGEINIDLDGNVFPVVHPSTPPAGHTTAPAPVPSDDPRRLFPVELGFPTPRPVAPWQAQDLDVDLVKATVEDFLLGRLKPISSYGYENTHYNYQEEPREDL